MKFRVPEGRQDAVAVLAYVLLALSVLLGGASRENALPLALVELSAVPLLVVAGLRLYRFGSWRDHKTALAILGAIVAVPLLQLVPLPVALWSHLPGRDQAAASLEIAGVERRWLPFSLVPDRTWASLLALIPPAAMFVSVLSVSAVTRRRLAALYLVAAVLGLLLGASQILGGADGPLYPYSSNHNFLPLGFFANRNHFAALLVACLPFAGALVAVAGRPSGADRSLAIALPLLFYLVVLVGIAALRSRAGVVLAGPALVASLLLAWRFGGKGERGVVVLGGAALSATAVAVVSMFALAPILARFDRAGVGEDRFDSWPLILQAADRFLPLGAGLGAFDPVFRSYEPLERITPFFLNHAHNDYLELWVDAGWAAVAVLGFFAVWLTRSAVAVWTRGHGRGRRAGEEAAQLARGASLAIFFIMLHSVVDYPLRTETIAVFMAYCCGLLSVGVAAREGTVLER